MEGWTSPELVRGLIRGLWWLGLALAVLPVLVLRLLTYPVAGSQRLDALPLARWLWRFRLLPTALGVALAAAGAAGLLVLLPAAVTPARLAVEGSVALVLLVFVEVFADPNRVFRPLDRPTFTRGEPGALEPERLVLGLVAPGGESDEGEARAYPLYILSYHHAVEDTVAGEPVLATYCGLCRSGRIFRPRVAGRRLTFRLVGVQRTNLVLADRETGTWWRQATGRALAGPLAGETLPELPADQVRLDTWLDLYPDSRVLQPDPATGRRYGHFGISSLDWQRDDPALAPAYRWVVTVRDPDRPPGDTGRGVLPWSELNRRGFLLGTLPGSSGETAGEAAAGDGPAVPFVLRLAADGVSFRAWDRRLAGRTLDLCPDGDHLLDEASGSRFAFDGVARGGALDGRRLRPLLAHQEMRHSSELASPSDSVGSPGKH